MVKLTVIGRIRDGMPLAQGLRYVNEDNGSLSYYARRAEFILIEISRASFTPNPKFIIRLDHQQSFKILAFEYLEDLRHELEKFEQSAQLIEKITRSYSFVKFDNVISCIRKQYIDTRAQANLKKLNAKRGMELDIIVENMSTIVERRRQEDYFERVVMSPQVVSSSWASPRVEVIALKWIPIGITISVMVTLLLRASLMRTDHIVLGY